jgi:hypothetical protein
MNTKEKDAQFDRWVKALEANRAMDAKIQAMFDKFKKGK